MRKIQREARQVEIELREFLTRMGIADADEEAKAICERVVEDLEIVQTCEVARFV